MAGVLSKSNRLKRRQQIKELVLKGKSVAEIAKIVDLTRQAVYEDIDRLVVGGELPTELKRSTASDKLDELVAEANIVEGESDIEIALRLNVSLQKAAKIRKHGKIRVNTPINISARRNNFVTRIAGEQYRAGKNFVTFFAKAFVGNEVLYNYFIRGESQPVDKRHVRGYYLRTFKLEVATGELLKKDVICQV